jgi:hypothetical protein
VKAQEKQIQPRRRRRLTVRFRPEGSQDASRTGFTEDVSAQGLFVQTVYVLPKGTALEIEIDLGEKTVTRRGVVAWAKRAPVSLAAKKRSGMGVRLDSDCPELAALVAES